MEQITANQQYKYIIHFDDIWIAYNGTSFSHSKRANHHVVSIINAYPTVRERLLSYLDAAGERITDIKSAAPNIRKLLVDDLDAFDMSEPEVVALAELALGKPTAHTVMQDYADALAGKSIDICAIWHLLHNNIPVFKNIIAMFRTLASLGRSVVAVIMSADGNDTAHIDAIDIIDDTCRGFSAAFFYIKRWNRVTAGKNIAALANCDGGVTSYCKIKMLHAMLEVDHSIAGTGVYVGCRMDKHYHTNEGNDYDIVEYKNLKFAERIGAICMDDDYQRITQKAMNDAFRRAAAGAVSLIKAKVELMLADLTTIES